MKSRKYMKMETIDICNRRLYETRSLIYCFFYTISTEDERMVAIIETTFVFRF